MQLFHLLKEVINNAYCFRPELGGASRMDDYESRFLALKVIELTFSGSLNFGDYTALHCFVW